MEFRNLTPLDAIAFKAVDGAKNEFNVVTLKAAYQLQKRAGAGENEFTHDCVLLEGVDAVSLSMADEYEGEVSISSVKQESDLAPFKPACDVLVRAVAHAPDGLPADTWPVHFRLWDQHKPVIAKTLRVTGPRVFRRHESQWRLGHPTAVLRVPMRWEYAFGGTSKVLPVADPEEPLLNEVCFSNPLGCGWLEKRYLDLATRDDVIASSDVLMPSVKQTNIDEVAAPQIESWTSPVTTLDFAEHPSRELTAQQMAAIAATYSSTPAGLSVVGRAWAPRLQQAGSYDDVWLKDRWPYLPEDFNFRYWNGAPPDQQIPWPRPDFSFELVNLTSLDHSSSGSVSARLPGHRAVTALRFVTGAVLPLTTRLDTVFIDTETMQVSLTWRAVFPLKPDVRVCEARFETDINAPSLRYEHKAIATQGS